MNYKIKQSRGCGIEYTVFSGTFKECKKYLLNVAVIPQNEKIVCGVYYTAADPNETNGNNQPFDYYLKKN